MQIELSVGLLCWFSGCNYFVMKDNVEKTAASLSRFFLELASNFLLLVVGITFEDCHKCKWFVMTHQICRILQIKGSHSRKRVIDVYSFALQVECLLKVMLGEIMTLF